MRSGNRLNRPRKASVLAPRGQSQSRVYASFKFTQLISILLSHWFRVTMNLPAEWADVERVQLEFDPSCEAMIFDTEGCPLQGITGGGGIDRRVEFILPKEKRASGYKCAFPVGEGFSTFEEAHYFTRRLHRGLVQCHVRQRTLRDECAARHEPLLHGESPSPPCTQFTLLGRPQRLTSGCAFG